MPRRRDQQHLPGRDYDTINLGQDLILAGDAKDGVLRSGPWFPVHFADKTTTPNTVTNLNGIQAAALARLNLAAAVTAHLELNWQDATSAAGAGAANAGDILPDPAAPPGVLLGTGELVDILASVAKLHQSFEGFRSFARLQWKLTLSSGSVDTVDLAFAGRISGGVGPVA